MRIRSTRANDSTFDLNLAPFLDIIVSIIPMLLLSVAFIQIKMIEAPTPQVVTEQTVKEPPKPETTILLRISKARGFVFEVTDPKGKVTTTKLDLATGQYDLDGLLQEAIRLKERYPEISKLQLMPEEDVSFDDIVKVIDQVRQKPRSPAAAPVSITDAAQAKPVQNSYLFPEVIFASIGG